MASQPHSVTMDEMSNAVASATRNPLGKGLSEVVRRCLLAWFSRASKKSLTWRPSKHGACLVLGVGMGTRSE